MKLLAILWLQSMLMTGLCAQRIDLNGLSLNLPTHWQPLASPSPSLLRWRCDGSSEAPLPGGVSAREAWLSEALAHPCLALSSLPQSATDPAQLVAAYRASLHARAPASHSGPVTTRIFAERTWYRQLSTLDFAGRRLQVLTYWHHDPHRARTWSLSSLGLEESVIIGILAASSLSSEPYP